MAQPERQQGRTAARVRKEHSVLGEIVEQKRDVVAGLTSYFKRYPGYAKYYGVRVDADGEPNKEELERVADKRVIIRLRPV